MLQFNFLIFIEEVFCLLYKVKLMIYQSILPGIWNQGSVFTPHFHIFDPD